MLKPQSPIDTTRVLRESEDMQNKLSNMKNYLLNILCVCRYPRTAWYDTTTCQYVSRWVALRAFTLRDYRIEAR